MAKRSGGTPEEDLVDWFMRMGLEPEEMTDIYTARSALASQLEGTAQYPYSASQGRASDWAVANIYRPMSESGVHGRMAWNVQGYWEIRYSVKGERGLFGWERTKEFITERTGIIPALPPFGL